MTRPGTEDRHPASEGLHFRASRVVLQDRLAAQARALEALHPALPGLKAVAAAAVRALSASGRTPYALAVAAEARVRGVAIVPVLILYLICSRQLIRGITAGAVK